MTIRHQQVIEDVIQRGQDILARRPFDKTAYAVWQTHARTSLERIFGTAQGYVAQALSVGQFMFLYEREPDLTRLRTQIDRIRALMAVIPEEREDEPARRNNTRSNVQPNGELGNAHVFVVHGRDERALNECARFVETLGLVAVVLREQPNQGRTIIEKFEGHADVGFAIVLLTGDDRGASAENESFNPRARQNVIFELGFFVGRLGRHRVCALYQPGVELPSDFAGVVYEELDLRGAWKLRLAQELRSAGLPVDLNRMR